MALVDGVAYPKLNTIFRPPPYSVPSAPPEPHQGVAVEFNEMTEVRQMPRADDFTIIDDQEPVFMPVMSLRKQLQVLKWLGLVACILQIIAACAIPVATYTLVLRRSDRFAVEDYVHWGIAVCAGVWGMLALGSMQKLALAIHVVFGAMLAAALAAHNNALFGQLENRCTLLQAAYTGCDTCACALLSTCTSADLVPGGSCPGCSAPTAEFCNAFDVRARKILLAITGPVTVVSMAVPVVFSLVALLRIEMADGLHLSNRVAQALAMIHQQLIHLNAREDLHVPLNLLMANIRLIEAEGGPGMLHLADLIRTALARAGFDVAPREYDNHKIELTHSDRHINIVASPPSAPLSHQSARSVTSQYSRPVASHTGSEYQDEEYWHANQAMSSRTIPPAAGSPQVAKSPPESPLYYAAP